MEPKSPVLAALEHPKKKVFTLVEEFEKFALKGNVIDMAIAVIIGTAFTKVVEALVKNVMMPLISVVLPGEGGYDNWLVRIWGVEVPFGKFIGETVNFLIVAFVLFIFTVKFLGWLRRLHRKEAEAPPPAPDDIRLLTEICDLLKERAASAQNPPSAQL